MLFGGAIFISAYVNLSLILTMLYSISLFSNLTTTRMYEYCSIKIIIPSYNQKGRRNTYFTQIPQRYLYVGVLFQISLHYRYCILNITHISIRFLLNTYTCQYNIIFYCNHHQLITIIIRRALVFIAHCFKFSLCLLKWAIKKRKQKLLYKRG